MCITQQSEAVDTAANRGDRVVAFGYAGDADSAVACGGGVHGFPFFGVAYDSSV